MPRRTRLCLPLCIVFASALRLRGVANVCMASGTMSAVTHALICSTSPHVMWDALRHNIVLQLYSVEKVCGRGGCWGVRVTRGGWSVSTAYTVRHPPPPRPTDQGGPYGRIKFLFDSAPAHLRDWPIRGGQGWPVVERGGGEPRYRPVPTAIPTVSNRFCNSSSGLPVSLLFTPWPLLDATAVR